MRRAPAVRVLGSLMGLVALIASGCGSEPVLAGYERSPEPIIDVTLPAVNRGGADMALRAEPGELLFVYFGFANCPDICPTTLADARQAVSTLGDRSDRVNLALITVDPERDTDELLTTYVEAFIEDGIAMRTTDNARLLSAADLFGVTYAVQENDAGEIEVGHTPNLFVVDDTGTLKLTWPFGTLAEDIANDLNILFDRAET